MTDTSTFTVYDTLSGEIFSTGFCAVDHIDLQAGVGQATLPEISTPDKQYIFNDALADKPTMPVVVDKLSIIGDGIDVAAFSNVPVGAVVSVGEGSYVVSDGLLEFSSGVPGVFEISIEIFPYLPYVATVTVS